MTTRDPHGPEPQGVSVFLSVVIGATCFGALAILGLGMLSFFTNADIISVEGMSMWPGVIGMVVAVVLYAAVLTALVRRPEPSFSAIVIVALLAAIAHLVAVWIAAMSEGAGYGHSGAAVGQLITGGSSLVIVVAGLLGGWFAVALRRSRSGTPQWPWERHGT